MTSSTLVAVSTTDVPRTVIVIDRADGRDLKNSGRIFTADSIPLLVASRARMSGAAGSSSAGRSGAGRVLAGMRSTRTPGTAQLRNSRSALSCA